MIRLPHRKEEKLRKIKKTWNQLYQKNKKMPAVEDIASALNVETREVEEILAVATPVVSFDSTIAMRITLW